MNTAGPLHVSPNRLEGDLSDTPFERLLSRAREHLLTGAIKVGTRRGAALVELRAGAVERARFGELAGDAAIDALRGLRAGSYELRQCIPGLDGKLAPTAELRADARQVRLADLMRHCEDNALTCEITVAHGFDRGVIAYRAGEIVDVTLNGARRDSAVAVMSGWRAAKFRVKVPPLAADFDGWPVARRAATAPVVVEPRKATSTALVRKGRSRAPTVGVETDTRELSWRDVLLRGALWAVRKVKARMVEPEPEPVAVEEPKRPSLLGRLARWLRRKR